MKDFLCYIWYTILVEDHCFPEANETLTIKGENWIGIIVQLNIFNVILLC